MLFNSLHFALFFPLVLATVWLLRKRLVPRNLFLLAASYYFYAVWDWRFLGLLALSTLVDYCVGRALGDRPDAPTKKESARRKRLLVVSCVVNLGILGCFKYFNFFVSSAAELLEVSGLQPHIPTLSIILPVGISFYTFQSLSYTIDVYRGQMRPQPNLLHFALYVGFFTQLVAGPIERAKTLLPQIETCRPFRAEDLTFGFYLALQGLFKKVVLADNAAVIADKVFAASDPSGITTLLGGYAFAVQVYGDFSGYTDIARGCARMMGFNLMRNFNHPYLAVNPSDFWQRWHISLSTWLRDYLYIPLGGNRRGTGRTYFNLMVTMVLGGLWHGAAWNFVIWGAFHGALLCTHRLLRSSLERFGQHSSLAWRLACIVVFFHVTCIGLILFRGESVGQIWQMLLSLATQPYLDPEILSRTDVGQLACVGLAMALMEIVQYASKNEAVVFRFPWPVRAAVYAAGILAIVVFGDINGPEFIYFQF